MRATTDPIRTALPLGVIRPSQRPNVPRPDAYAACRSDHVEAKAIMFGYLTFPESR